MLCRIFPYTYTCNKEIIKKKNYLSVNINNTINNNILFLIQLIYILLTFRYILN